MISAAEDSGDHPDEDEDVAEQEFLSAEDIPVDATLDPLTETENETINAETDAPSTIEESNESANLEDSKMAVDETVDNVTEKETSLETKEGEVSYFKFLHNISMYHKYIPNNYNISYNLHIIYTCIFIFKSRSKIFFQ